MARVAQGGLVRRFRRRRNSIQVRTSEDAAGPSTAPQTGRSPERVGDRPSPLESLSQAERDSPAAIVCRFQDENPTVIETLWATHQDDRPEQVQDAITGRLIGLLAREEQQSGSTADFTDLDCRNRLASVGLNDASTVVSSAGSVDDNDDDQDGFEEVLGQRFTMTSSAAPETMLPTLPEGWKGDSDDNPSFKSGDTLSASAMRKIEPVGPPFLAYARRKRYGRTFSEDDRIQAQSKVKKVEDDDDGEISEPEDPLMLARDAKDWKSQDHYKVLGLSKYRYKATDEQIKKAHRKKVLRHHPDKKAAAGQEEGDSFFKCLQRANEILTDPVKRRQFDSVDEEADVDPPTKKEVQKPGAFYKKWGAVFESEARFSKIQPVPKLGDEKSTKEEVDEFYNFWYNFDSWRTFEYLDEDVPDDNEARDHKRHVEKKNANARRKRKNEDIARLRKLVDECLGTDERIKKFRQEKAKNKNKGKVEEEARKKAEAEAKQKAKEEEEAKKKADDEAAKAEKEQSKKAKEAAKNAVKKNKRVVRGSVKDVNYFVSGDADAKQIDDVLNDTDAIIAAVDPDELAELVSQLTVAGKDGEKVKEAFVSEAKKLAGAGKLNGEMKIFK